MYLILQYHHGIREWADCFTDDSSNFSVVLGVIVKTIHSFHVA